MKLYQANLSPFAARVRIQLRAKGLEDIELVEPPGGLGSNEYKSLNPIGKIPLLEVDGKYIAESAVICEYIEDRWPEPALLPADPMARAQTRLLVQCVDLYVTTPMFRTIPQLTARPRNQEYLDLLLSELTNGLKYVDEIRTRSGLAGTQYAIGDSLTLADGAIAGAMVFVQNFAIPSFKLGDIVPAGLSALFDALRQEEYCGPAIEEITDELMKKRGG
jgi:glutathione S-transferase